MLNTARLAHLGAFRVQHKIEDENARRDGASLEHCGNIYGLT
jgi:hypothetical protein